MTDVMPDDAERRAKAVRCALAEQSLFMVARVDMSPDDAIAAFDASVAAAIRAAVVAERARIITIIDDCEPADVYYTDEDGEEYPEPVGWDTIRTTLKQRIEG